MERLTTWVDCFPVSRLSSVLRGCLPGIAEDWGGKDTGEAKFTACEGVALPSFNFTSFDALSIWYVLLGTLDACPFKSISSSMPEDVEVLSCFRKNEIHNQL